MKLRNHTPSVAHSWLITYLALALLVPAASTQNDFGFLQPLTDPIQCETHAFAWTGGTPPYQLQVSVSNWNKAYGISGLGGPGFPWTIPVPAGYAVSFELLDNANHVAAAGPLTIQPSNDTSCFGPGGVTSSSTSSTTTSSTTTSSTTTSHITTTSSSTKEPTTSSSIASSTDAKSSVTPASESRSSHPPSPSSSVAPDSVTSLTISPSSSSQASPTTDVTWSTTVTATIAAPTATIAGDRSPTSPHRATLGTGAVAGLAVAGAAVLVLAGIAIWFCRRRKRRSRSGAETNVADSDMPIDSDVISSLNPGGPQMSEAVTSARRRPRPLPTPSSSSRSDPKFAFDGSRQLLLHTHTGSSEDGSAPVSVSVSSHLQRDGAPQSTGASLLSPSRYPTDIQSRSRASISKSASPELALASRQLALATDTKPDSPPRDLPLRPSHPSRGPERIPQTYAAIPTDERSFAGVGAGAHLMRFEEDGGVRLAGGLPGDVLDEDGNGSVGWVVHPPPYQRFG